MTQQRFKHMDYNVVHYDKTEACCWISPKPNLTEI